MKGVETPEPDRSRARARAELDAATGYAGGCSFCRGLAGVGWVGGVDFDHADDQCPRLSRSGADWESPGDPLSDLREACDRAANESRQTWEPATITPDVAAAARRLSAALRRDREESGLRLLTRRLPEPWRPVPSGRARRSSKLRQLVADLAFVGALLGLVWLVAAARVLWR